MSIIQPEIEMIDRSTRSIRYLEHGWRGKAFVGDHIGDFKAGDLFMTGPNLPHNWITDQVWTEPVAVRDMLVQFSHDSVEKLAKGFPEFSPVLQMLQLAQSGILFEGFNPTFARGHMESIRDNIGAERILAFVRLLVRGLWDALCVRRSDYRDCPNGRVQEPCQLQPSFLEGEGHDPLAIP